MRSRLLAVMALLAVAASCEPTAPPGPSYPATETYAASLGIDLASMVRVDTNLYYKDVTVGTGTPEAVFGKKIVVNYSGFLVDGTNFESTLGADPDTIPLTYQSGLIAGWILGIPGMKPGGVRRLVMGSSYAYGAAGKSAPGKPTIPPNATLIYDIQLRAVK